MREISIGQTKYYNNRPVLVLKNEGNGFYFVVAELNLTHDQTGSNWCTMCQAGGDFIASHTCDTAQEVIDHLMENIEDREVFWVSERYLNDEPFEFKPYQKLVSEIENLNKEKESITNEIKKLKSEHSENVASIESQNSIISDLTLRIQQSQHDLMSVESDKPHKELPKTLTTGIIDLSTKELTSLVKSKLILDALESGGVDNWQWYSESCGGRDFDSEAIEEVLTYIKK